MSTEPTSSSERERRLHEVLLAYEEALEAGRAPDRREWLDRHPEFAAELEAFFANRDHLDRLAGPLRPPARPAPEGVATCAAGPGQAPGPPEETGEWTPGASPAALTPTGAADPSGGLGAPPSSSGTSRTRIRWRIIPRRACAGSRRSSWGR